MGGNRSVADLCLAEVTVRDRSRMIGRIVSETQFACGLDGLRVLEEHLGRNVPFDRAMFMLMILRESSGLRGVATGLASAGICNGAGISINAVAMSLSRPFETVRRHVHALIDDGICERVDRMVVFRPKTLALPAFDALLRSIHDRMVALIETLRAVDLPLPTTQYGRSYDPNATIASAIDLVLAPFDYLADQYSSWLELVVVNAVVTCSARSITNDPELSLRYSRIDTVPPETVRQPVTIGALSRWLRMSYSTVRREVEAGIAAGKLVRSGGGVLASAAFLSAHTITQGGERAWAHTAHVLRRLSGGGFRFDDPACCYLDGRPAPLAFD